MSDYRMIVVATDSPYKNMSDYRMIVATDSPNIEYVTDYRMRLVATDSPYRICQTIE